MSVYLHLNICKQYIYVLQCYGENWIYLSSQFALLLLSKDLVCTSGHMCMCWLRFTLTRNTLGKKMWNPIKPHASQLWRRRQRHASLRFLTPHCRTIGHCNWKGLFGSSLATTSYFLERWIWTPASEVIAQLGCEPRNGPKKGCVCKYI